MSDVQVSALSGRLIVTGKQPVDEAAVLAAVDTAGDRASND